MSKSKLYSRRIMISLPNSLDDSLKKASITLETSEAEIVRNILKIYLVEYLNKNITANN